MVRPLEVVVVDVALLVALETGEADVQAGEGGPPALLEDEAVQRLGGDVGLGAAGTDERVPDAQLLERGAEVGGAKLAAVLSVSTRSRRQPAAASSAQTLRASFEVWTPVGLPLGAGDELTQAYEEATSIAVSCQT